MKRHVFYCPRCQKGKIYRGMLSVVDQCSECGLKLKQHEQGDGPAFFAIVLVGTLAGVFSAIVEIKYEPPFWVHAVLWIPFILIGSLFSIRLFKAVLIAIQYRLRGEDFR